MTRDLRSSSERGPARHSVGRRILLLFLLTILGLVLLELVLVALYFEIGSTIPEMLLGNAIIIAFLICANLIALVRSLAVELSNVVKKLESLEDQDAQLRERLAALENAPSSGARIEEREGAVESRRREERRDSAPESYEKSRGGGDEVVPTEGGLLFQGTLEQRVSEERQSTPSSSSFRRSVSDLFRTLCVEESRGRTISERFKNELKEKFDTVQVFSVFRDEGLGAESLEFSRDRGSARVAQEYLAAGSQEYGYCLVPIPLRADMNFGDVTGFIVEGVNRNNRQALQKFEAARLRSGERSEFVVSRQAGDQGLLVFS